jgi:hypothetical protein
VVLVSEERIVRIFEEAGASDDEIALVRKGVSLWLGGLMTGDELFYYLMGIAREMMIPLTPKQVGDLREAIGLPRSWE